MTLLGVWSASTLGKRLPAGKRARGACMGQQVPPSTVSPQEINVITVAAVKTNAATIVGKISGIEMEVMLDSGSTCSTGCHCRRA